MTILPPCTVCGAHSTSAACDVMRHEDPARPFVEYSPVGRTSYGCDEHPATSREFVTELPRPKILSKTGPK